MNVILDNYPLPEQGATKIEISLAFEIKITAEQARKKVNRWVMENISSQMGGDPPLLVAGARPVWRVPAYISFSHTGHVSGVGAVDVDVETGGMLDVEGRKKAIEDYLEKKVLPCLPPYKPQGEVPPEFVPTDVPPAEVLIITDDGQLKPAP